MLPPVAEALSLVDIAVVNHELNAPPSFRRAIQILVDHIQYQSVQLSRCEDILAAYGNPTQQGGTVWSKLAGKADLSRLEKLEHQVEQAFDEVAAVRSRQSDNNLRQDECSNRVELLRDQVASLESKLGVSPSGAGLALGSGPTLARLAPGWPELQGTAVAGSPPGGSGRGVAAGSAIDRIQKLERRVEGLGTVCARTEEEVSVVLQRLRDSETRMDSQHGQLRADIKQALALSAASSRAEAEAEAAARVKESERRTLARVQSVEEQVDNKVSAMSARVGTHLNGELDKRFQGLYEHVNLQVSQVKTETDRLAREKVDTSALEHYTSRVSTLFEQVAGTLGEDTRALSSQLGEHVVALRQELQLLGATKADKSSMQSLEEAMSREDEAMRMLAGQVREMMAHIQDSLASQPRAIEELRLALASSIQRTQDDMEHVQRAISGLNNAVSSSSSAMEVSSQKTAQLSHKLNHALADLAAVKAFLFGASASAAAVASGTDPPPAEATSLSGRVSSLERHLLDVDANLATKVAEPAMHDFERRMAALQRQADEASDGVKALTSTTYKRVDEHASAIQRLTLAISSNLDDRPTITVVKNLMERLSVDLGERVSGSLVPLWDVVKAMQASVKDAQGELKATGRELANVVQQQADLRTRVAGERGALATLVRRTMEEELGMLVRGQLEQRLVSLEESHKQVKAQVEVQAQLQDRQHALTSSIEDQVSNQLASSRAAGAALRTELGNKVDAAAAAIGQRVEVMEVVNKQHQKDLQAVRELLVQKLSSSEVQALVEAGSRLTCKQELARHKEREDARWQVWLEQFSDTLDRLVSRADVDLAIQAAAKQTLADAAASAEAGLRDTTAAIGAVRTEVEAGRRETELRVEAANARVDRVQDEVVRVRDELGELASAVDTKADSAVVEQRLRRWEGELSRKLGRAEAEAELAKKLDVRAFLANSTSVAATAAVAGTLAVKPVETAAAGGGGGGGAGSRRVSPMRQPMGLPDGGVTPGYQGAARRRAGLGREAVPTMSASPPKLANGVGEDEDGSESSFSASMAAATRLAERVRARKAAAAN